MLLEPVSCWGTRHWQAELMLRGVCGGTQLNAVTAIQPHGQNCNPPVPSKGVR